MKRHLVPVRRDTAARLVPTGDPITVPKGSFVTVTQSLGRAYTIVFEGNMARIEGEDADAIGMEPKLLHFDPPADGHISQDQVWEALRDVYDPEIPVNIVELGLIYGWTVNDVGDVHVDMTLTSPGCGMGPVLVQDVERNVGRVPFVQSVDVELTFDPPWSRDMMTEEAQLELGLY